MKNKKYIVKLLPIERKLKIGDTTFWPAGDDCLFQDEFVTVNESCILHLHCIGCKPHKKFLCNRDIQVGDKVFLENSYNYFSEVIDKIGDSDRDIVLKDMPQQRENGTLDSREMVKVIGEISPDATWVKDGDEFDENSVFKFTETEELSKITFDEITRIIYIKGPCGHFH